MRGRSSGQGFLSKSLTLVSAMLAAGAGLRGYVPTDALVDEPGKCIMVFVDVSSSVKTTAPYGAAWDLITKVVEPGDRLILGVISDNTLTSFRPVVNTVVPNTPWHQKSEKRRKNEIASLFKNEIAGGMEKTHTAPRSKNTEIMASLVVAGKTFESETRECIVVLLSDMLEDSPKYDFEDIKLTPSTTRKIIEERRAAGFIPDLHGATFYIAGECSLEADKMLEVERFWTEYIRACNGRVATYAPTLMAFP